MEIKEGLALCVLNVVDQGLSWGLGDLIPGKMCLQAAVSSTFGEDRGNRPSCTSPVLHAFQIGLNDAQWSSNEARARGLRRIAIAQLGSAETLDESLFLRKLAGIVISKLLPKILRSAAAIQENPHQKRLLGAAIYCESDGTARAASAAFAVAHASAFGVDNKRKLAFAAAQAANAAALADAESFDEGGRLANAGAAACAAQHGLKTAHSHVAADQLLSEFAEDVVQILVEMKTPGSNFLFLTQ